MASPPFVPQGTLNRVRCSVVLSNSPALNITSPYMSKSFARISFSGVFTDLIPTATGAVASPEPYVIATITVGMLRTQALSNAWLTQAQTTGAVGPVTIYPDSSSFQNISLDNAVIDNIDPGAYDGTDPTVRLTLKGVYYINSAIWSLT